MFYTGRGGWLSPQNAVYLLPDAIQESAKSTAFGEPRALTPAATSILGWLVEMVDDQGFKRASLFLEDETKVLS